MTRREPMKILVGYGRKAWLLASAAVATTLTGCAVEIPLKDQRSPSSLPQQQAAPPRATNGPAFKAPMMALLVACTFLGGCAVGPEQDTPFGPMRTAWSRADGIVPAGPLAMSRWWSRLNDPMLDRLVDEAVEGNLTVETAKARVREARASYRQAVGALLPTLRNTDSAVRSKGAPGAPIAGAVVPGEYSLFQAGFDTSWELDLFGANRRAVEAADYGVQASEDDLDGALLTLIGDVAVNYVQARGFQARIDLARRSVVSQEATAELTRNKLASGTATALDVANATGQAAATRSTIPTLETALSESIHRISVLTGRDPTALNTRLAPWKAIPAPKLPMPAVMPAEILLTRPDVRAAERRYAQSTARIGQAEAARYPSVSLTGNIATAGTRLGDLGRSSTISWSVGPSLTVPLFNGGRLRAAVEIAEAQRDQAFLGYHASVLTALREVEDALVALGRERTRSRTLAVSASSYRQAASLSRSLYQTGSASFLDVLTAERSLYTAEDALLQSRVLIASDFIALNKALGSGWDGPVDASRPVVTDADTGPRLER